MSGGNTVVELWGDPSADVAADTEMSATGVGSAPPLAEWASDSAFEEPVLALARPRFQRSSAAALVALLCLWLLATLVIEMPWVLAQLGQANHSAEWHTAAQLINALVPGGLMIGAALFMIKRARDNDTVSLARMLERLAEERRALSTLIAGTEQRIDAGATALHGQGERLDALGTATANKIATLRAMIDEEIAQVAVQTNNLKNAAAAARSDMAVLLANLPKAQVETRKMSDALYEAGAAANMHSVTLIEQFGALSQQATRAEVIAVEAADLLAKQIASMDRQTSSAQAQIAAGLEKLARAEDHHLTGLTHHIAQVNGELGAISTRLAGCDDMSARLINQLREGLADVEGRLAAIDTHGTERTERLNDAIKALTAHSQQLREELARGGDKTHDLIAQAEGLMVALDAATRELDESLPAALTRVATQTEAVQSQIAMAAEQATAVHHRLTEAGAELEYGEDVLTRQASETERLRTALTAQRDQASALAQQLANLQVQMAGLSGRASADLVDALVRVKDTASVARERAQEALRNVIPDTAAAIETASKTAFAEVMDNHVKIRLSEVADVAASAVSSASEAADRLMRQMLTIVEANAAFTAQMQAAEDTAESNAQATISRRVSLLIESLNSISIDVAKILSNDVTDAAWASYLKGDRGVFTRRAVKLVDGADAREILRHYENNPEFCDHVNRYIHDFEAMLRMVLNARETGPLSVTLLSSDMGKLYVALAHAIERLRT